MTTPLQQNTFRGRAELGARLYNNPHTPYFADDEFFYSP
jgi:hypothetical protein